MEFKGHIAVEVTNPEKIQTLCSQFIPGYDASRFEPVALRVFAADEFIVTVFAVDKENRHSVRELRDPVRKFKLQNLSFPDLYDLVSAFNFTLAKAGFDVSDMDVINR